MCFFSFSQPLTTSVKKTRPNRTEKSLNRLVIRSGICLKIKERLNGSKTSQTSQKQKKWENQLGSTVDQFFRYQNLTEEEEEEEGTQKS